ncbi:MAG TPA: ATP-binding protein [Terracidiphilus sp.]|jgi:signal transduction histidine kinase|nr:ATP-binding protein [Terracidiphilus sp.]
MLSPTLTPPACPTPAEQIADAIDRIGALHGLTLKERLWLARHGEEVVAEPGGILFEEGSPADRMILILKGEIHVRRKSGGPMELFIGRSGQMTGYLPFSRMTVSGGQGYAATAVWALTISKSLFPEMLEAIPSMSQRVVSTLLDRVREVTRIEQQAEKLTALGKLAGNLAHEFNNPASAAQRAASNLVTDLRSNRQNRFRLVNLCLDEAKIRAVENWEQRVLSRRIETQDAGELIAREDALRVWLSDLPCEEAWEVAAQLSEQGVTLDDLHALRRTLDAREACVTLQFFARYLRSTRSVDTLLNSTARIFDLISAVKAYSYLDRAPIIEVDVPAGLDATVQMLQSRMSNVTVERDFQPELPTISAYGSELNQVWTALIENALDALGSPSTGNQSTLKLTCRMEPDMMLVEIWDTGPGIPAEIQDRIFEPFFTTKAPGAGLGLGLDNAMRIVRKHRGHISVRSEPGSTCFRVRLPMDQLQAY